MATLGTNGLPTLLDLAKMQDPKGDIAKIAEVLSIDSPLIQRIPWMEANGNDGHLVTTRTGLPSVAWRKYNEGVTASKGGTAQFTETCGMLDGVSKVDVALAKRNGNEAAFRLQQDLAFIQSYKRTMETAFFYSDTRANPERIMGLSPRLDALTGIPYASQVIPHTAVPSGSDQASIWVVGFGAGKVYGIYPKGSQAGLQKHDMGEELETDTGSAQFRAYRTYFSWHAGLVVEDARYLVRIPNIDTSDLALTGSTLIQKMMVAVEQLQSLEDCTPVIFMNRKIRTYLRAQAVDTVKNSTLAFDMVGGKPVMSFQGLPIERTDALLNTEAIVS
jgi:hypothetical protein